MTTDEHWERWGARDPYYGVLTRPEYRREAMDPVALEDFFQSGSGHLQYVMGLIHRGVDPHFRPRRVLDFGCGVGRVLVPFSRMAEDVLGLDVSPSMLAEARRNCDERGIGQHVRLARSDDALSAADGEFCMVHSCIVLQHLELDRGREIFRRLVGKVRAGGIGALHVTYAPLAWAAQDGRAPPPPPPAPPPGPLVQLRRWLRERLVGKPLAQLPPVSDGGAEADPEMQMNWYDLNQLVFILQASGMQQIYVDLTDHGGAWGTFLCFRRP